MPSKIIVTALLLAFVAGLEAMPMMENLAPAGAALPEASMSAGAPAPGADNADYLLVLVAEKATLELKNATDPHGVAKLELSGVPRTALWFTDLPVRRVGQIRTSRLAEPTSAGFWAAAPNVALTGTVEGNNHTSLVVMSASNPQYKDGDLYLDVVLQDPAPLGNKTMPAKLARSSIMLETVEGELKPEQFKDYELELKDASLFIDAACYSGIFVHVCGNGYGDNAWGVGVGPWRVGGVNCPGCGGPYGPYYG